MAFPIPDHLAKRPIPVDVSSKILYKIDSATNETLNAELAASWIQELDESIYSTKLSIHERIHENLPEFQRQLEAAKSVQTQFQTLTNQADGLNDALSNAETGILPTLLSRLQKHSALVQEASDAKISYETLSYVLKMKDAYFLLSSLSQSGKLPEAKQTLEAIQALTGDMPQYLKGTKIMDDFNLKIRTTQARIEDQLNDAFTRAIIINPTSISVRKAIQVRKSDITLHLSSVLSSITPAVLSKHLAILRRDFLAYFVDHILKQPFALTSSSEGDETRLLLIPAPPNADDPSARLDNFLQSLTYLDSNVFSLLPSTEATQFKRTLGRPITSSILNNLLVPLLPSSFGLLPSFLSMLKKAVVVESEVNGILSTEASEQTIKLWSDGISGHYERRRRNEILEQARHEILQEEDLRSTFQAVSDGGAETSLASVVPVQDGEDGGTKDDAWGFDEPTSTISTEDPEPDGWGLDEATPVEDEATDEWGLDDGEPYPVEDPPTEQVKQEEPVEDSEPDPADAWGWKEDEESPIETEEVPETDIWDDDPWANPPEETDSSDYAPLEAKPGPLVVTSPKPASRLEKSANKSNKRVNGNGATVQLPIPISPAILPRPSHKTVLPQPPSTNGVHRESSRPLKRPAEVLTSVMVNEYYQVPKRTKRIVKMVETVIDESKLFFASNLFSNAKDAVPAPGAILAQSASAILDLYQALYPVRHAKELSSPECGMLFSNSCQYMAGAIQIIEDTIYGQPTLKDRLSESRRHLQVLADSWYDDIIRREQEAVDKVLVSGAMGFTYTGDQDRYDDCEAAVTQVLRDVKKLAQRLNGVLAKGKYYAAIGLVTEAALSRVLHDVIALPDIPELESRRLGELCRILNALEGLFSEDPSQPSFVLAYVPSWLKYSYLSELLEASLADITYLFEQGALVDFRVEELVSLVRALFADTSLRTNTINKLMAGHPSPS